MSASCAVQTPCAGGFAVQAVEAVRRAFPRNGSIRQLNLERSPSPQVHTCLKRAESLCFQSCLPCRILQLPKAGRAQSLARDLHHEAPHRPL